MNFINQRGITEIYIYIYIYIYIFAYLFLPLRQEMDKMRYKAVVLVFVITGLFLGLAAFTTGGAHGYTLTKENTATHTHTYEWEGLYFAKTSLTIHWTYRQYYIGHHMVYSEIVSHGDPGYLVNVNPWIIILHENSKSGVVQISNQEQVAYGDTNFDIAGYGYEEIYTTIHYSSTGSWYSQDGFGSYT